MLTKEKSRRLDKLAGSFVTYLNCQTNLKLIRRYSCQLMDEARLKGFEVDMLGKVVMDGRIFINEVLKMAKIQPGGWVEITPAENKITIKIAQRIKSKGAVRVAAGILGEKRNSL